MASVGGTERSHVTRSTHGKSWSRNKGSELCLKGDAPEVAKVERELRAEALWLDADSWGTCPGVRRGNRRHDLHFIKDPCFPALAHFSL